MLLEFSIQNYRSFKDRQTLSMIPDETKTEHSDNIIMVADKYKLLKFAAIYGANASGKSNFIKAFQALRDLIEKSAERTPGSVFEAYDPFVFQSGSETDCVVFEIDFLLENIRYSYEVALEAAVVLRENLVFYPSGKETRLFSRAKQTYKWGDALKGSKAIIAELTAENQLYLSKAAVNNLTQLAKVYDYFRQHFLIIPVLDRWEEILRADDMIKASIDVENNSYFTKKFKSLLKSFDTGIIDIQFKKKDIKSGLSDYDILAEHAIYDRNNTQIGTIFRPFQEESTGTRKLFVFAGLILQALLNGSIILIDEFERSLHPLISSNLIKMFNDPDINNKGGQLIIATHDTNLLNNQHLRRDQIWIVEKDATGASELFSIADIKGVRSNIPLEQWYLSGRFGGIANFKSLDFELALQHETE